MAGLSGTEDADVRVAGGWLAVSSLAAASCRWGVPGSWRGCAWLPVVTVR